MVVVVVVVNYYVIWGDLISSDRPDKLVGIHFFNPVQLMKLVEVIHTEHTCPTTLERTFDWAQGLGKVAVKCGDTPGFIVNRLLVPNMIQAMKMH